MPIFADSRQIRLPQQQAYPLSDREKEVEMIMPTHIMHQS